MDKKKLAAAISAVFTYIKTSEEAAAFASHAAIVPDTAVLGLQVVQPANVWGITGRSNQMQASTMMQLRMFK
ncbi:MAG: hypothetical protein L3J69_07225 [Desulfobacula sp.]|nr:hypothetical protein [Desulfobacula sp.]